MPATTPWVVLTSRKEMIKLLDLKDDDAFPRPQCVWNTDSRLATLTGCLRGSCDGLPGCGRPSWGIPDWGPPGGRSCWATQACCLAWHNLVKSHWLSQNMLLQICWQNGASFCSMVSLFCIQMCHWWHMEPRENSVGNPSLLFFASSVVMIFPPSKPVFVTVIYGVVNAWISFSPLLFQACSMLQGGNFIHYPTNGINPSFLAMPLLTTSDRNSRSTIY